MSVTQNIPSTILNNLPASRSNNRISFELSQFNSFSNFINNPYDTELSKLLLNGKSLKSINESENFNSKNSGSSNDAISSLLNVPISSNLKAIADRTASFTSLNLNINILNKIPNNRNDTFGLGSFGLNDNSKLIEKSSYIDNVMIAALNAAETFNPLEECDSKNKLLSINSNTSSSLKSDRVSGSFLKQPLSGSSFSMMADLNSIPDFHNIKNVKSPNILAKSSPAKANLPFSTEVLKKTGLIAAPLISHTPKLDSKSNTLSIDLFSNVANTHSVNALDAFKMIQANELKPKVENVVSYFANVRDHIKRDPCEFYKSDDLTTNSIAGSPDSIIFSSLTSPLLVGDLSAPNSNDAVASNVVISASMSNDSTNFTSYDTNNNNSSNEKAPVCLNRELDKVCLINKISESVKDTSIKVADVFVLPSSDLELSSLLVVPESPVFNSAFDYNTLTQKIDEKPKSSKKIRNNIRIFYYLY